MDVRHSSLVSMARKLGAGGIWVTPSRYMIPDLSGWNRHAIVNDVVGTPYAEADGNHLTAPAYRGAGGAYSPYIATIPNIGEANTFLAYIYIPDSVERGAFIMASNNGGRGVGMGVGNGTNFETTGNTFMSLNESIAWNTHGALGTGWKLCVLSTTTGASQHKAWLDGALVSTQTRAALFAGTTNQMRICGYNNAGTQRSFSGGLSLSAWWDRALTDDECRAISAASRRHKMVA